MRSKALGICCITVCCVMLYLASTVGQTSAQDRAVPATKGHEEHAAQVESAAVEGDGSDAPIEFFPIPPGTVFRRDPDFRGESDATAGADKLVYSNLLGTFGAAMGRNRLVSDDITTTVPGGCQLTRFEFPVIGKVDPAGIGGTYKVTFAMYRSCPQAVPVASRPGLIIPGTLGQKTFLEQCLNATDDDLDVAVNDGCPVVGAAESGAQCSNNTDDDLDGKVNDGCPAVGQGESFVDSVPVIIPFDPAPNTPLLETNMWFGVEFDRANAGLVVGTPPMTGFSCDQFDFPGFPCDANAGGFPDQPQASFNLEIYANAACTSSWTGYKNEKPSGTTFNPGTGIFLADDIRLGSTGCNMIAYEVAVRGEGFYTFKMRNNCQSLDIPLTQQTYSLSGPLQNNVNIARFTFSPPIALPQNIWFEASVNNDTGSVIITGKEACIGSTADLLRTVGVGECFDVLPDQVQGSYGAINVAITCAGAATVGACCDMFITQCEGGPNADGTCTGNIDCNICSGGTLNGKLCDPGVVAGNNPCNLGGGTCPVQGTCESVCRQVPKTNCPYPEPGTADRPVWVASAVCEPDPFTPRACGKAACCKPDGSCADLTYNECYAVAPLESLRQWQQGRYCNLDGQRCPNIACLAREGECTLSRCVPDSGVCNVTRLCEGGVNPGGVCTSNTNCRVCPNKTCTGSRVCSKKRCNGSPSNTVCTGEGQGTCPVGQTCGFVTCTSDTNCTAFGATCPVAVPVCTGDGQGTCPPNQTCSFTTCTADSNCTRVCSNKACSGAPANTVCTGEGRGTCPIGQICNYITCTSDTPCIATGGTCQPLTGACPAGGVCGTAPRICSAGLIDLPCTTHAQCESGECDLTTNVCKCNFDSHCDCPGFVSNPPPNGTNLCMVGSSCCESCPPIGCEEPECCTAVCNKVGNEYCCDVEWDDFCAGEARTGLGPGNVPLCDIRPANDVCAPAGRLEGARLVTSSPPSSTSSDSGRATEDSNDPGFGCYLNNPGAKGKQTVWYRFVATDTSALIQTCTSNAPANDSLIAVFAVGDPSTLETACASLSPIACGDDFPGPPACSSGGKNAKVCAQRLTIGDTYYVMVASKIVLAEGKAYTLNISTPCSSPSIVPGDFCPDAQVVLDGVTPFNFALTTMAPPVETCIPTMINDKWYEYTATCTGTLTVETCGADAETSPDTNLAIYKDCGCPPLSGSPIECSADAEIEDPSYPECGLGSKLLVDAVEGDCFSIRLADKLSGREPGNLTITCEPADCPAGGMTFTDPVTLEPTDPPNGVVDAGRPHDPNNAASLQGIQTITAYGPRDALSSCFTFCETTSGAPLNSIASVVQDPIVPGKYTITLTKPLTAGESTAITYTDIHGVESTGRFTSSPGNVNADPTTWDADVDELVNVLNGTAALVWGPYSGDINRSGDITPADLLEEIDLMTDGGPYDPPVGGWDFSANQSGNPVCPLP